MQAAYDPACALVEAEYDLGRARLENTSKSAEAVDIVANISRR